MFNDLLFRERVEKTSKYILFERLLLSDGSVKYFERPVRICNE